MDSNLVLHRIIRSRGITNHLLIYDTVNLDHNIIGTKSLDNRERGTTGLPSDMASFVNQRNNTTIRPLLMRGKAKW